MRTALVALACAAVSSVWVLALTVASQQDDIHVSIIMISIAIPGLVSMALRKRWDRWYYWLAAVLTSYMIIPDFLLLFLLAAYTWLLTVEWSGRRG